MLDPLLSNASADLSLISKPIRRLTRKSVSEIKALLSKGQITVLDEADLKLADKKVVYVINVGGKLTASNTIRLLAIQSARSGRNVVLCDTTGQIEKELKDQNKLADTDYSIHNLDDSISVMPIDIASSFFTLNTFNARIKELAERFDQVFICTSSKNAQLGLMALIEFSPGLVMIAGLRKTNRSDIKKIKSRQPIDILFHD